MSFMEGGAFKCYTHNFTTDNPAKWDAHCIEEGHTQSGNGPCAYCGTTVAYDKLPYVKMGLPRYIVCKKCEAAQSGAKGKKST